MRAPDQNLQTPPSNGTTAQTHTHTQSDAQPQKLSRSNISSILHIYCYYTLLSFEARKSYADCIFLYLENLISPAGPNVSISLRSAIDEIARMRGRGAAIKRDEMKQSRASANDATNGHSKPKQNYTFTVMAMVLVF